MKIVEKFGLSNEECTYIDNILDENEKKYIDSNSLKVEEVLNFFKNLGVNKFLDLLCYRFDLLFCPISYLEEKFKDFDNDFIKFIIEEDIQNLIILGI